MFAADVISRRQFQDTTFVSIRVYKLGADVTKPVFGVSEKYPNQPAQLQRLPRKLQIRR